MFKYKMFFFFQCSLACSKEEKKAYFYTGTIFLEFKIKNLNSSIKKLICECKLNLNIYHKSYTIKTKMINGMDGQIYSMNRLPVRLN